VEFAEEQINTSKPENEQQEQSASMRVESEFEGKRLRRELVYLQKHTPDVSTTRKGEVAREADA
jgi:hypothetical protein